MRTEPAQETTTCSGHAQVRATWRCMDCGAAWCGACVKQVRLEPTKTVSLCPTCQGLCERISALRKKQQAGSFGEGLLSALAYPFKGSALVLLIAGAFVQLLFSWVGQVLLSRSAAGVTLLSSSVLAISALGVVLGAYVLCYLRQVLLTSSDGDAAPPLWPEFEAGEVAEVALQFVAVGIVSFGPASLCRIWLLRQSPTMGWVTAGVFVAGLVYFPMAVLAVTIYDNVAALNPLLIAVSIVRTLPKYCGVCLWLSVLAALGYSIDRAIAAADLGWLRVTFQGIAQLFGAVVLARVLGWFYYTSKGQLAWK